MAKAADLIKEYLELRDVSIPSATARHKQELKPMEDRMAAIEHMMVAHSRKNPELTGITLKGVGQVQYWTQTTHSMGDPAKVKEYIIEDPEARIVLLQNRLTQSEIPNVFGPKVSPDTLEQHGISTKVKHRAKFMNPRKK